jgi:hypothetical protein
VYDNTSTSGTPSSYIARDNANNVVEFGDQIVLGGTDRKIQDFRFEYFLGLNASGNETARLRLYKNDGAGGAPGSVLYDSDVFSITPGTSGYQNITAQGLDIDLASSTFTWTVLFGGVDAGETAGLILSDPPSIGSSFFDFWQNTDGSWSTVTIAGGATPGNFAARVTAVPEPATYALLAGGLTLLGFYKARRRS